MWKRQRHERETESIWTDSNKATRKAYMKKFLFVCCQHHVGGGSEGPMTRAFLLSGSAGVSGSCWRLLRSLSKDVWALVALLLLLLGTAPPEPPPILARISIGFVYSIS